tara:strand:- start:238 stop:540 length:303 start_codon:yes stop_codon:yes gene_type:complete
MTLHLTLKKVWFNLMISGKKKIEYRKSSLWIQKRLLNKKYDYIKFVNGYGNDKPYFICKYKGYQISKENKKIEIDGNPIEIKKGDYLIHLGSIIEKGNLT